jgi:UDP-arabinose 4-epimerase
MKILVTGGAGYIGSHACKVLAAHGHEPIVYDNLSRGHSWAVKWGPFENGNIADSERLRLVFARHRPAALMHFAGYTYVGESVENPLLYYSNNIAATAALLRSLVTFEPIPVVFSSTAAVYGVPRSVPISEDHPEGPINPYGFSKYVIERMLADVDAAHGVRSVSLRYFNAAGADPGGKIGEDHNPETHLVPLVLAAARDGNAVQIYGNDYDTPDGTCIRDYVHVMDIAEAHVRALDYLLHGGVSCTCNLANAHGYSVSEVIKTAERVTGKSIQVQVAPRRAGDPPTLIGRVDRAKTILGWSPQRSDLETQIGDAWNWLLRGSRQR